MKNHSFLIAIFCFSSLFGQIHEIKQIDEVFDHIHPETLILFDVDDTLICAPHLLGREQWFHDRVQLLQEEGFSLKEAQDQAFHEWHAFQHITRMDLVEEHTSRVIERLQEEHVVMALTARDPALINPTRRQLAGHGIFLEKDSLLQESLHLSMKPTWTVYSEGVIFTCGGNKGKALFAFLDQIGFEPKEIVFVDDRKRGLSEVEECALERGIPFTGLRYGYLDVRSVPYDRKIAREQHAHLFKILSNEEAKEKMIHSSREQED